MSDSLSGKTALITGAAKRIGRGIALALADAGANVVVHYNHSATDAKHAADEIRERGVKAWTLAADLGDGDQAGLLFASALRQAGAIDILVNNASIFPAGTVLDFDPVELSQNVQVNAYAPLTLMRAFFAQEREGTIVNLLDSRMSDYDREHAAYHLSKRMLFSLTKMCALEFAPRVRVNAVAPGLILPPPGEDESYLERMKNTNPLCRYGSVGEIAKTVLFLLTSPFVTGETIRVDGGRHMKGNVYG